MYPYPTIRIEIRLKGDWAKGGFSSLLESDEKFIRVCAGHIEDMTGFQAVPETDVPVRVSRARSTLAASLAALVDQWGDDSATVNEIASFDRF